MPFYNVIFENAGEVVSTFALHAADPDDAKARAMSHLRCLAAQADPDTPASRRVVLSEYEGASTRVEELFAREPQES